MLVGLPYLILFPMAAFSAGPNDCGQEIWAMYLLFGTPFPACFLAIWKRAFAGLWLLAVGVYWPIAWLYERAFMIGRHLPQPTVTTTLGSSALVSIPFVLVGTFAIATRNWPKLLEREQSLY
jgi:uncharacterized membrane protein